MKTVGKIQLQEPLGESTWAQTYKGLDTEFDHQVVVKIFSPAALGDPTIRARYQREIQLVNSLRHPSIVPILNFSEENEHLYIVMPFLQGGSLEDRLRRGPVPPDEAALAIQRIAAALDAVHSLGILHGDLKASNILFDHLGFPMLSDFGMIKFAESIAANFPGAVIGPPVTLSPERILGNPLEPTDDIYALGLTFYQMLGGQLPFAHGPALQAIFAQQSETLPNLSGSLSPFNEIIFRATHQVPASRYTSAGEFSKAVSDAIASGAGAVQATLADLPRYGYPPPPPETASHTKITKKRPPAQPELAGSKKKRARKPASPAWRYARFIFLLMLLITLGLAAGVYLRAIGYHQTAMIPQEAVRVVQGLFTHPTIAVTDTAAPPTLTQTPRSTPTLESPKPSTTPTVEGGASANPTSTLLPTDAPSASFVERPLTPEAYGQPLDYQPVRGENLFDIAGSYHADLSEILKVNGNNSCSFIIENRVPIYVPQSFISSRSSRPAALSPENAADFILIHSLECMTGITLVDFSPDGDLLAVAVGENVYIWDAQDWTPVRILRGHMLPITAMDFSPDSQVLVTGSKDTLVKVWDPISGKNLQTLYDQKSEITAINFNASGKQLATLSVGQGLVLYNSNSYNQFFLNAAVLFTGGLSAAYSPTQDIIVVGFNDRIQLYDTSLSEIQATATLAAAAPVDWLVISPDGRLAASGKEVWHLGELTHLYSLERSVGKLVFAPDSQTFFGGGTFWKTANGRIVGDLAEQSPPGFVSGNPSRDITAITSDGMYLVWANQNGVTIWALPDNYPIQAQVTEKTYIAGEQDTRSSVANQFGISLHSFLTKNGMDCTNPIFEGQQLVIPTDAGAAQTAFSLNSPPITADQAIGLKPLHQMEMTCANISGDLIFSADGSLLISGSAIWNVPTSAILVQTNVETVLPPYSQLILSTDASPLLALSPDNAHVAIRSGKNIEIWDLDSGFFNQVLSEHKGEISGLSYSPDGQILASGGVLDEPSIRLWQTDNYKFFSYIQKYPIFSLTFSLDSQRLVGETLDTFRVWNVGEIEPFLTIPNIDRPAVLSPDRKLLAYIRGSFVIVHDLETDVALQDRLAGTLSGYQKLQFAPDNQALAAANNHGIATWDIQSGELTHWLSDETDRTKITLIAWSPDGRLIAAVANQTLRIWDVEAEKIVFSMDSPSAIRRMLFSPGGQFLTVLTDYDITLWGVAP